MTGPEDLIDRWRRAAIIAETEADAAQAKLARIADLIEESRRDRWSALGLESAVRAILKDPS